MTVANYLAGIVLLMAAMAAMAAMAGNVAADDALDIMTKSHEMKRVEDQIATLTFRFISPDKPEKRAVYIMAWKNMYGEDGFDNKAMFFTESPPEKKDIAYLGWLRIEGSDKLNDEWIYLPELRMTRRIVQRNQNQSHDDDEFGNSLLTSEHLKPRPPGLDDHALLEEQLFNDKPHYVISSTPKVMPLMQGGTVKRVNWVDKDSLRLSRVQFFNKHGKLELDMQIEWTELQGYWIWRRIEAIRPDTAEKTLLEFSDFKLNSKLKDRMFHTRNLEKGAKQFR